MIKKNILVTATGGRSVGSGILHSLTRSSSSVTDRWNIIASDADSFAWGLYKVEQAVLLPLATSPDYKKRLKKVISEYKIDAIIPGSEAETTLLSYSKDEFDIPIITNHTKLMPLMMDKFKTIEKLKELGFPFIPTYSIAEKDKAINECKSPFIIKPTEGTGGSKGVKICSDIEELTAAISLINDSSKYCIQPLIGDADNEFTVGVLSDKNGSLIDSIVMKRKLIGLSLLETRKLKGANHSISTGYSQGFFIEDKFVSNFCEQLAIALKSTGPLNIQLRLHEGQIYVFEIHSRFSGTTPMRADMGFNEPDTLLRNHLFNEKFGRLKHKTNVAVIRAFEHVIVPIDNLII